MIDRRKLREILQQAIASAIESGHFQFEAIKTQVIERIIDYFRSTWDLTKPVYTNGFIVIPDDVSFPGRQGDLGREGHFGYQLPAPWHEVIRDRLAFLEPLNDGIHIFLERVAAALADELAFLGHAVGPVVEHVVGFLSQVLADDLDVAKFTINHYFVIFMLIDVAERLYFLNHLEKRNYFPGEVMQSTEIRKVRFESWISRVRMDGATFDNPIDLTVVETGFTSEKLVAVTRLAEQTGGLDGDVRDRVVQMHSGRVSATAALPKIWYNGISNERLLEIAEWSPEFNFVEVTRKFAHPELAAIRRASLMRIASKTTTSVHLVGPSIEQVRMFRRVGHVCLPVKSGRDFARHDGKKLESSVWPIMCHNEYGKCEAKVDDMTAIWMYSAQSVHIDDVVEQMVAKKQRKAILLLTLAAPLMIDGVNKWTCPKTRTTFMRDGKKKKIMVMHASDGEAGYVDDEEAHLSWFRPIPTYSGLHVHRETKRSIGCHYEVELEIGFGEAEEYPTQYTLFPEPTYLVPMFEEGLYMTTPCRQANLVIDSLMYPGSTKSLDELAASKIRATRVELRIGGVQVRAKWEVEGDEFAAMVAFCVVMAERRRKIVGSLKTSNAAVSDSALRDEMQDAWSLLIRDKFRTLTRDKYVLRQKRSLLSRFLMGDGVVRFVEGPSWWKPYHQVAIINQSKSRWFEDQRLASLMSRVVQFALSLGRATAIKYFEALPEMLPTERFMYDLLVGPQGRCEAALRLVSGDEAPVVPVVPNLRVFDDATRQEATVGADEDIYGEVYESVFEDLNSLEATDEELARFKDHTQFRPEADMEAEFRAVDRKELETTGGGHEMAMLLDDLVPEYIEDDQTDSLVGLMMGLGSFVGTRDEDTPVLKLGSRPVRSTTFWVEDATLLARSFFTEPTMYSVPVESAAMFQFIWAVLNELKTGVDKRIRASVVLEGVASSGKTSVMLEAAKRRSGGWLAVVPSRVMKESLEKNNVRGMQVVTRHGGAAALRSRPKTIWIDEVYQFTTDEIRCWQFIAAAINAKLVVSGEARQGFREREEEIGDLTDAIRAQVVRTMTVANAVNLKTCLVLSRVLGIEITTRMHDVGMIYQRRSEDVRPFEDDLICARLNDRWPAKTSATTCQGQRFVDAIIAYTEEEVAYYGKQPGCLYVALTRPKRRTLLVGEQFVGFEWTPVRRMRGWMRKEAKTQRETKATIDMEFEVTSVEQLPMMQHDESFVPLVEAPVAKELKKSEFVFDGRLETSHGTDTLFEELGQHMLEVPFTEATDGTIMSTKPTKGISAIAYEGFVDEGNPGITVHPEVQNMVGVQKSKNFADEVGNITTRTAKMRDPAELVVNDADADLIFKRLKGLFDDVLVAEFRDGWAHWIETRTSEKLAGLRDTMSGVFGEEAASTRFTMFLKKQLKVKEDPKKFLREGYGQPIMSGSNAYNAEMAGAMQRLVSFLILCSRSNVIFDIGLSATEYADLIRLGEGQFDPAHATGYDIKAQDTSHNATTNKVFVMFLEWIGVPKETCVLYQAMRREFNYRSMSGAGMKGTVSEALGSGDPMTIGSNSLESAMIFVDRFETLTARTYLKIKGDNIETTCAKMSGRTKALRFIEQTVEYQGCSHFAGYVSTDDNTIQDPIKMLIKFYASYEIPEGGLVAVHQALADRFVHRSIKDFDKYVLVLQATYSKILSDGGVREGMDQFARLQHFGYMYTQYDKTKIREYVFDAASDCIWGSIVFLRVPITRQTFVEHYLADYARLKAYVSNMVLLCGRFKFYDCAYDPELLQPFNGIHVFTDHALAFSATRVNIEEFEKRRKKQHEDYLAFGKPHDRRVGVRQASEDRYGRGGRRPLGLRHEAQGSERRAGPLVPGGAGQECLDRPGHGRPLAWRLRGEGPWRRLVDGRDGGEAERPDADFSAGEGRGMRRHTSVQLEVDQRVRDQRGGH